RLFFSGAPKGGHYVHVDGGHDGHASVRAVALVASLCLFALLSAQAPQPDPAERFTVSDAMIPMRDGVKLHTKIFTPKEQRDPLPFIMKRTPYGIERSAGNFTAYMKALADEGYIFVFQDIRGKFRSEGTFVMQRPAR